MPLSAGRIARAFVGAAIAATGGLLFYKLLSATATSFANSPVTSDNVTVVNLSAAVRTLVLGTMALGAGVFGMTAIGLLLLGLQMTQKRLSGQKTLTTEGTEPQN